MMKLSKRIGWLTGLCAMAFVFAFLPGTISAETASGKDKAMWAWFPNEDINTEESREEMVSFAEEKGVNVIYLNIGAREDLPYIQKHPEQYQAFIQLAHANGIEVHALDGAAEWALAENRHVALSRLFDVLDYNRTVEEDEKFDGIQFDIEPYLLDEWDTDERTEVIDQYLKGLHVIDSIVQSPKMKSDFEFMVAMPFWFDGEKYETTYKGVTQPLSDHVMDTVSDGVAIMAYRDFAEGRDSISYHTEHEVDYANQIGSKVILGVETQYLEPYEKVSFFEEGEAYMNEQLQILDELYENEPSYAGQAIHKYQSYQTMKP
ncbi:hypothetical protein LC065_08035 [Halobacillus litoralis]|uniref:hypothetical protein n=1 Tax=Halobacillus litoralis TaxID=45668 RepID=UPI001CFD6F96|nr:hypothetical protein [Halobacillus litoralis]WLR49099.1 hypothetical protein LC065_08035 [Halobacillus litoralis]